MSTDWTAFLGLGAVTAVVSGTMNGIFKLWGDSKQRKAEADNRVGERLHQRNLRAEEAHADARLELLSHAAQILDWIEYEWAAEYGVEADYTGEHLPKPELKSVMAALSGLRKIEIFHPTKAVRIAAKNLRQRLDGHYNVYDPNIEHAHAIGTARSSEMHAAPSRNQFEAWTALAEELVESIHLPREESAVAQPRKNKSRTSIVDRRLLDGSSKAAVTSHP